MQKKLETICKISQILLLVAMGSLKIAKLNDAKTPQVFFINKFLFWIQERKLIINAPFYTCCKNAKKNLSFFAKDAYLLLVGK